MDIPVLKNQLDRDDFFALGFAWIDLMIGPKLQSLYQFRVLKKWCDRLRLGPGARAERAGSIGWVAPGPRRSILDSAGEGGGSLPRPSTKKSAPNDSKRADLDPGPKKH